LKPLVNGFLFTSLNASFYNKNKNLFLMAEFTANDPKSVFVSNISNAASEKTVSDFFSFCGKISKLYLIDDGTGQRSAVVQFETEAAAKTALLLTNALIVDRPIEVVPYSTQLVQPPQSSATSGEDHPSFSVPIPVVSSVENSNITQRNFDVPDEERTKTSVIASMVAAGYVLASDAFEKAVAYDEKHSISTHAKIAVDHLKAKVQEIDQQYKISEKASAVKTATLEKAKQIDQDYKLTEKANQAATSVKTTAQAAAAKAQENPTVSNAITALRSTTNKVTSSVTSVYNDYKDQTVKAIAEKRKEKQEKTSTTSAEEMPVQQTEPQIPLQE
jgi:RNA recognition motif-containing protein